MKTIVGKRVPKKEGTEKVIGQAKYGTDINLQGMLWGMILRSPYAHARILHLDISKAMRLVGIKAAVTAKDVLSKKFGFIVEDQTPLAQEKVRFMGESVACVAAVDLDIAKEALQLIEVEYEELPALYDPLEAMNPDSPFIHEQIESYSANFPVIKYGNVCSHTMIWNGNGDRGLEKVDLIFEDTFTTQMIHQAQIEPHAALAYVEKDGKVTICTSTQGAFGLRAHIAKALSMPLNKIRVLPTTLGGSFGSKSFMRVEPYCILLSQRTGHPVKIEMSREEEFISCSPRHPCIIEVKTGVSKEGILLARKLRLIYDTGAFADFGPAVASEGAKQATGPYRIPDIQVDSFCVYTNKVSSGCCRSHGTPQPSFALESQMDIIARSLDMDPVEIRWKNLVKEGDISPGGQRWRNIAFRETLEKVFPLVKKEKMGKNRGRGIACGYWYTGGRASSASIELCEDGSAFLLTGAVDATGSDTVLAQIVSEELGLPMEKVILSPIDTALSPYDAGSSGSRIVGCMGNAVKMAAEDVRNQMFQVAAESLEAHMEDLELKNERIYVKGFPERNLTIEEIAKITHHVKKGPIRGRGSFMGEPVPYDTEKVKGLFFDMGEDRCFVCQIAEVEIDEETGRITLLNLTSINDVGFAINPLNVEGQIQGGAFQGMGFALSEEIQFQKGRIINPAFSEYKLLPATDIPKVEAILVETGKGFGPYGAKGIGEPPNIPTAPAIANAICDALGIRIKNLPITPEKILRTLKGSH